jgi:hypothetical protein
VWLQELQDKLAHLEAVHAVAQESAMQSEHELQHARRLLAEVRVTLPLDVLLLCSAEQACWPPLGRS